LVKFDIAWIDAIFAVVVNHHSYLLYGGTIICLQVNIVYLNMLENKFGRGGAMKYLLDSTIKLGKGIVLGQKLLKLQHDRCVQRRI
jgi:hypothetical protein